jgi:hypothetical protein
MALGRPPSSRSLKELNALHAHFSHPDRLLGAHHESLTHHHMHVSKPHGAHYDGKPGDNNSEADSSVQLHPAPTLLTHAPKPESPRRRPLQGTHGRASVFKAAALCATEVPVFKTAILDFPYAVANTFLQQLSPEAQLLFMARMVIDVVEPKKLVFAQGKHAHTFYVLLSGTASLYCKVECGETLLLRHLHTGDCIGELELLAAVDYCGTLATDTCCEFATFDKTSFLKLRQYWNPPRHVVFSFLEQLDILQRVLPVCVVYVRTI